jgi:selenide,water dikinase
VRCESGLTVDCDRVFWVTNAAAPSWVKQSGLATDDQGFLLVKDTLQSCSHPQVFAAGDVATMANHPRPKAGVFAVRQGPPLFHNLRAAVQGQPLKALSAPASVFEHY